MTRVRNQPYASINSEALNQTKQCKSRQQIQVNWQ